MIPTTFKGLKQNELIKLLVEKGISDMPVRVIQVDETRKVNLRIEDIEVVDGEIHVIIDNLKE